jgi:hypothetical protein
MSEKKSSISIPDEVIMSKIYLVRGEKVMLDRDIADLYGIATKVLKQTVRRNRRRFPSDFMFEMSTDEFQYWRSRFVTSNTDKMGLRYPPFCFTEHGVLMLSSVLKSELAIAVNIQIIRIFTRMRKIISSDEHDNNIILIFEYIKKLEQDKQQKLAQQNRKKIGY